MRTTLALLSLFCFAPANAYKLPQHPIKSYDCEICDSLSHEHLQDRWKTTEISLNNTKRNTQKSYSYNKQVTAQQLEQGVILPIHAPGAVVRITPLEDTAIPELELKSATNPFMSLKDASSLYSQDEAIDASLKIGTHQAILQIKPELGIGNFIIKSKKTNSQKQSSNYLIHVFEKNSSLYLQIEPAALQYQYGDQFNATITLKDNDNSFPLDDINALLIGPNDQSIPLKLNEIKRNQYEASAFLLSDVNTRGDNWYIQVDVTSELEENNPIHRTGRAAFSYSIPSAGLVSIKKISSKPLTFAVTADVATASRYALQSILYKKNAAGKNIPVETAQSARWMEPGRQIINFSFDNSDQLAEDQLSVGYLHLTDYGQLKPVYQHDVPIKLSQLLD